MKRLTRIWAFCLLLVGGVVWQPVFAHEGLVPKEEKIFRNAVLLVEESFERDIGQLVDHYRGALEDLKVEVMKSGDLDAAMAVDGELKQLDASGIHSLKDLPGSAPARLRKLRDILREKVDGQEKAKLAKLAKMGVRHLERLKAMEVGLAKQGNFEGALGAREARTKLEADPRFNLQHPKLTRAEELKEQLAGTKWSWNPRRKGAASGVVTFRADGVLAASWKQEKGSWEISSPNEVSLRFPLWNFYGILRFNPIRDEYTLYHEESGVPLAVGKRK